MLPNSASTFVASDNRQQSAVTCCRIRFPTPLFYPGFSLVWESSSSLTGAARKRRHLPYYLVVLFPLLSTCIPNTAHYTVALVLSKAFILLYTSFAAKNQPNTLSLFTFFIYLFIPAPKQVSVAS